LRTGGILVPDFEKRRDDGTFNGPSLCAGKSSGRQQLPLHTNHFDCMIAPRSYFVDRTGLIMLTAIAAIIIILSIGILIAHALDAISVG